MELWVLDLETKQSHQLTSGGAVNVEPRFSPDGKRLAFVSISYNRRFHIFVGDFSGGELTSVRRLTRESRSNLPRFYYSEFDHEISPTWSPDGEELIFVSNRGHIYGTGGFWRMKAQPGAEPREILYEETAWKGRPDFSPDGKRIVYASYLGGQWHQLWALAITRRDAFPFPMAISTIPTLAGHPMEHVSHLSPTGMATLHSGCRRFWAEPSAEWLPRRNAI